MNEPSLRGDTTSAADVYYCLDPEDRITEIGGNWLQGVPVGDDPLAQRYVGTVLYDHVSGHFTRRFLRQFLAHVRLTGGGRRTMYRCDSFVEKRLIEMRASAETPFCLRLTHVQIAAIDMPFPIMIETALKPRLAVARRCSICNRLQPRGQTGWFEPEIACSQAAVSPYHVVHTVCADCRNGITVKALALRHTR